MNKSVAIIALELLLLLFSLSCSNKKTSEDPMIETPTEESNNTEIDIVSLINQSYNEHDRNVKLDEMRFKNENLASEAWELYETATIDEWLYGNWRCDGFDKMTGYYTMYVNIEKNNLRIRCNSQDLYNGPYEINAETHQIIFDRHDGYYTRLSFDPGTERLVDENGPFKKVKYFGGNTSTGNRKSNRNNLYGSSSGNSFAEQLTRLDNEESQIINVVDPIRRSGQFYPDILFKVMRMKQINDERIRLARQQGDRDLIQYYELQKMRSEAIIRQWGF